MESPRVQFSARNELKALNERPALKLDHVNALTDDTGMLHMRYLHPKRSEGTPPTTIARALIFSVL